MTFTMEILKLC